MFKSLKSLIISICVLLLASCSNTNKAPVIMFSEDSTAIVIKNIDATSLYELKKDNKDHPHMQNIISVVLMPIETDSLQDEKLISGRTIIQDNFVVFKPELPFNKNETYLVESYIGSKFADKSKLFKGTVKYNLEPQKQLLKR
ncbi:hypothetical protein ASF92_13245 [Pedobacter sp. Leaf176]|nr:hypothetical protein ASF92_13245 [Pedobacter sp. Leaf176]